jgi:glutathione S-transferase
MWILRSSTSSPFGRKITVGAGLCGLSDRIRMVTSVPRDPADPVRQLNPLGKLPTLVLEDGSALFDSRVILEWLDVQAGGGKIIPAGKFRFQALRLQAIGDGMMDASVQQMSERRHHEGPALSQVWMDYQREKVMRSLSFVTSHGEMLSGMPHVGHIALACALAYLDYRFDGFWRRDHPGLVDWLDDFAAAVPSFAASAHPA